MNTETAPQRPTIKRSTIAVENATSKGYTPETAPDATIDVNTLARGVAMAGTLTQEQTTRLRMIIATTPNFPCDFRQFMFIVQGWDMLLWEQGEIS